LPLQFQQLTPQPIMQLHAQLSELYELQAKFVLPPEEEDGEWRRGNG